MPCRGRECALLFALAVVCHSAVGDVSTAGGTAAPVYVATPALAAAIVDDAQWIAPALPWAADASHGPLPPSAVRLAAVIEGIVNTIIDTNATHVVEYTVVELLSSDGGAVEVDVGNSGAVVPRRFIAEHVKWVVAAGQRRGTIGAFAGVTAAAVASTDSGNRCVGERAWLVETKTSCPPRCMVFLCSMGVSR